MRGDGLRPCSCQFLNVHHFSSLIGIGILIVAFVWMLSCSDRDSAGLDMAVVLKLAACCVFDPVVCLVVRLVTDDWLSRLLIQFLCAFNYKDGKPSERQAGAFCACKACPLRLNWSSTGKGEQSQRGLIRTLVAREGSRVLAGPTMVGRSSPASGAFLPCSRAEDASATCQRMICRFGRHRAKIVRIKMFSQII
jgi:hypothetical protein